MSPRSLGRCLLHVVTLTVLMAGCTPAEETPPVERAASNSEATTGIYYDGPASGLFAKLSADSKAGMGAGELNGKWVRISGFAFHPTQAASSAEGWNTLMNSQRTAGSEPAIFGHSESSRALLESIPEGQLMTINGELIDINIDQAGNAQANVRALEVEK